MAKAKIAAMTYTFLVKRDDNIWNNILEFEKDLADFFAAYELQAEPISVIEGSTGNRMVMIKRLETVSVLDNKPHKEAHIQESIKQPKLQKSSDVVKQLTKDIGKGIL